MAQLLHGDCLEEMKNLEDNSIDFIFCDLPYGQTSCKWDCCIDLKQFWNEIMRIKKINTPIFMTTTTKFGVELINSAPKKCPFRYDLVWVKSAPAGFLSAKKMPMRKHEMVYAFYEKLPFYDLSSHTHKFIKQVPTKRAGKDGVDNKGMIKNRSKSGMETLNKYDPPLPVSVVKEELAEGQTLGDKGNECYGKFSYYNNGVKGYEPPLPVSVVKEKNIYSDANSDEKEYRKMGRCNGAKTYEPPLPTTMLEIKSTRGKHSTEKPVALMEWLLKYFSKEGDVVLDPTMGSGSTGVACKNMNRNFIGIEKDNEIFEVACQRIWG
jgi:hypothetical protein